MYLGKLQNDLSSFTLCREYQDDFSRDDVRKMNEGVVRHRHRGGPEYSQMEWFIISQAAAVSGWYA